MIDEGLRCPFCGGVVWIAVCDDEGNLYSDDYADDPWSGLCYQLIHRDEDVPEDELCPIANGERLGTYLFDDIEEAKVSWGFNSQMTGIDAPPCEIGDKLWVRYKDSVFEVTVFEVKSIDKMENELHSSRRIGVRGYYMHGNYRRSYKAHFNWSSIDKSIFYTKEDAERGRAK